MPRLGRLSWSQVRSTSGPWLLVVSQLSKVWAVRLVWRLILAFPLALSGWAPCPSSLNFLASWEQFILLPLFAPPGLAASCLLFSLVSSQQLPLALLALDLEFA